MDDVDDQEGARSERTEQRQDGHRPQDEFEIDIVARARVAVCFGNGHGENGIAEHPNCDHVRSHTSVVILLHLAGGRRGLGHLDAIAEVAQRGVISAVDVELLAWHVELDQTAFGGFGGTQVGIDDVVALGAPGDVVGVAEGEDLERADI